jgi:hypothetical protein
LGRDPTDFTPPTVGGQAGGSVGGDDGEEGDAVAGSVIGDDEDSRLGVVRLASPRLLSPVGPADYRAAASFRRRETNKPASLMLYT